MNLEPKLRKIQTGEIRVIDAIKKISTTANERGFGDDRNVKKMGGGVKCLKYSTADSHKKYINL